MKKLLLLPFLLFGCEKPEGVVTAPIDAPQYPVAVVKPTPTPSVSVGWIRVQENRWNKSKIRPEKVHFASNISSIIQRNKMRYRDVEEATGVPWPVIGSIHNMEGSLSFKTHLHNGDPLTARTRHVPAGRPVKGTPPFSWEESAADALRFDKLDRANWNSIGHELQNIETYNGLGYQNYHAYVPTPYLWSWTTIYTRGKYIADGTWSDTAVSQQCGVVPILKNLE